MTDLFSPLRFACGRATRNRFMVAPLTNTQSHPDGTASEDDLRWLAMRARGGFGLVTTCAAHVQAQGQGFPGQLGIFADRHLEGLSRIAAAVQAEGSLALVQLHHAGVRSPAALTGSPPVGPSADPAKGARGLSDGEVDRLAADFVDAAARAARAGFDGVEIHGAHGYVIAQFLSAEMNHRTGPFGGSLENRARLLFDVVSGIRQRCGPGFILAVRLSPERFGMKLAEMRLVAQRLMSEGMIDLLDMSLWDAFKEPEEEEHGGRSLFSHFTGLDRGRTRLGVAGKITGGREAALCLEAGADLAVVGRAAILHHDFPARVQADAAFAAVPLPVTPQHLRAEGAGEAFLRYLRDRPGFVQDDAA